MLNITDHDKLQSLTIDNESLEPPTHLNAADISISLYYLLVLSILLIVIRRFVLNLKRRGFVSNETADDILKDCENLNLHNIAISSK